MFELFVAASLINVFRLFILGPTNPAKLGLRAEHLWQLHTSARRRAALRPHFTTQ